ncbi:hypothetical protein [Actinoplanes sp. M2I2]|uniref:hypothetical protein n=1 Tax=Actinoplanes sp. M2I2 TaxID=1734444 RepID=UPI002021B344|nr:hypothetical protein [Actinoplanes sp. M2I2]
MTNNAACITKRLVLAVAAVLGTTGLALGLSAPASAAPASAAPSASVVVVADATAASPSWPW